MDVIYKCSCMNKETTINVPNRREGVDILEWMEIVQICMGFDHRSLSPHCRAGKVEYAKIPIDENMPIGAKKIIN